MGSQVQGMRYTELMRHIKHGEGWSARVLGTYLVYLFLISEASPMDYFDSRKRQVPFRMALGKVELMQECLK